jgi:hypothetical protein
MGTLTARDDHATAESPETETRTLPPQSAVGPAEAAPVTAERPRPLVSAAAIRAARRYARSRSGNVSFAVITEPGGRPRGLNRYMEFPSASVSKAMLMVAVLRRTGDHPIPARSKALLRPMITVSDNRAASLVYASVGGAGLRAVARAARMQRFRDVGYWASARLTAADQARLFYRIDKLVPRRHRQYARELLASVTPYQRWGIARAAKGRFRVFFKGGWRANVNHQIALLERKGRRFSLAVLTDENGAYGQRTEEGIARILLRAT